MPELAAHLERAKELVNRILEFLDEGQLAEWAPIAQEAMVNPVAAALAACAREARLDEAKWWHLQVALTAMQSEIIDPGTRDECRERIEALERAAGEKA